MLKPTPQPKPLRPTDDEQKQMAGAMLELTWKNQELRQENAALEDEIRELKVKTDEIPLLSLQPAEQEGDRPGIKEQALQLEVRELRKALDVPCQRMGASSSEMIRQPMSSCLGTFSPECPCMALQAIGS